MDHRSRNADRTDTLRALSQEAARGEPQILQPGLQHKPCSAPVAVSTSERRTGCADGGKSGLICEHCGADLPKGSTIRREFCGAKCRGAFYTFQKQAARAEARKTQACLFCGGPMRDDYPQGKIYCSALCGDRSAADMRRHRNKRTCDQCGARFLAGHGQRFCCHACYAASRRKRHPKPCAVCGITFRPHRVDQVTCSIVCRDSLKANGQTPLNGVRGAARSPLP
jgi:hypothetical protein